MNPITIEETLKASDITTALSVGPYLIYSQIFEGPRRPLVFLAVCGEDFSLIGQNGNTIKFLTATPASASETTGASFEDTFGSAGAGMGISNKTFSSASVSVTTVIYSAFDLTDILTEDYPTINYVRMALSNAGTAILEKLDANVKDAFIAGGTSVYSGAALAYGNVVDAMATMENNDWVFDDATVPFLIVSPDTAAALMKDTTFVDARRYTAYEVSKMVEGEIGMFAGCRVLKTSLLNGTGYGFIVSPPEGKYGPVALIAWKRRLAVKNEYFTAKAYTYYVASIRAKAVITQALGIGKLTITGSP
jgi:hypothetical protein